jgi:hypothetical protein
MGMCQTPSRRHEPGFAWLTSAKSAAARERVYSRILARAARSSELHFSSRMHERAFRGRACEPARAKRISVYSRTALYGFPTANRDTLLVWRREMRSEGVANMPNRQWFWDQNTSIKITSRRWCFFRTVLFRSSSQWCLTQRQ